MPTLGFDWRSPFLEALRQVPVVQHACDCAGINRATAYAARKGDQEFAKAWDDAMESGVDRAEQEAFRRAVKGYEEPVIFQGRVAKVRDPETKKMVPLTIRKHSDQLLVTILKGRRKAVYAERTELTGADGKPVVLDATTKAARLQSLMEAAKKRRAAAKGEPAED